jgi:zinc transporter ZupT
MAYEALKIGSIIAFWVIQMLFGFLPICIPKFRKVKLLISLVNCFTAGLFVATGLVHIFPEATEIFNKGVGHVDEGHAEEEHADGDHHEEDHHDDHVGLEDGHDDHGHEEEGHNHGVSWPHVIVLLAFTLFLFIEKVLLNYHAKKKGGNGGNKDVIGSEVKYLTKAKNENDQNIVVGKKKDENGYQETGTMSKTTHNDNPDVHVFKMDAGPMEGQGNNKDNDYQINKPQQSENNLLIPENSKDQNKEDSNLKKNVEKKNHGDHDHDHDHLDFDNKTSIFSIIVILIALGIHAFLANLTVGIEDNKDTLITLIVGIAIHKWAEGLAIGNILIKKKFTTCKSIFIIIFVSIFTPLGGMTGLLLESSNNLVKGTFLAISAGAFLYIGIMELIMEEFKYSDHKYWKFLLYCLGIGLVMCLFLVR